MLDFCTAVADLNFTWHVSEGIKPIPLNTGKFESVYPIPPYFPFGKMFDGRIFLSKGAQAKKNASYRSKFGHASKKMIRMTLHSIIILVDRIACSDYEEERTLHPGYKKFLAS
jgi:hypothetical protein